MSQALQLATIDRTRPKQASLRRSISTTYYAVFHLLTSAVASNWVNRDQRPAFERILEHGKMAKASARMAGQPFPNQNPIEVQHLRTVARTFSLLQGQRHSADYDVIKLGRVPMLSMRTSLREKRSVAGRQSAKQRSPRITCCNSSSSDSPYMRGTIGFNSRTNPSRT